MGRETESVQFDAKNAAEFRRRIKRETEQVLRWGRQGRFASGPPKIGMEIEACLVDDTYHAAPINAKFLNLLNDPNVTTELARFNIEFNPPPHLLTGSVFSDIRAVLQDIFLRATRIAEHLNARLYLTGILPTLSPGDLASRLISKSNRYQALARQFAEWEEGRPARVDIPHNEGLVVGIGDVMMESVTTSQQIHIQIPEPGSAPFYNAAQVLAGPVVAVSANSPFFMGRNLWAESRVPVFEQVLGARFRAPAAPGAKRDDFFGTRYVDESALELFVRNYERLAVILPELFDEDGVPHLAMHNGSIWRWNRPVLSFDERGQPVLRIEFRATPSGPTMADMSANAAFFVGTVSALAEEFQGLNGRGVNKRLPFAAARRNFYACARDGLEAEVEWLDGETIPVRRLIARRLVPAALKALGRLGVDSGEAEKELSIIRERARTGRNGAVWQRAHMERSNGGSLGIAKMAASYYRRQNQNLPVHEWNV